MATDRLPKVLINYKPRGYRNIGRPIARREDAFSLSRKQACGLYPWSRRRRRNNELSGISTWRFNLIEIICLPLDPVLSRFIEIYFSENRFSPYRVGLAVVNFEEASLQKVVCISCVLTSLLLTTLSD
jgi:hypothetical protein